MLSKLFSSLFRRQGIIPKERRKLLKKIQRELKVKFDDLSILNQALTHKSFVKGEWEKSNERLEFLGDAVLGLLVSEYLYQQFPDKGEGELTEIKSLVVSEAVLYRKAEEIGLGKYILLSPGEASTGGREKESILSDAFEAVVGAIYIDRGLAEVKKFLHAQILEGVGPLTVDERLLNYKSLLQEYLQARGKGKPHYQVTLEKGPAHQKIFEVAVYALGRRWGKGTGKSKKEAEQRAAQIALLNLKEEERVPQKKIN